MNENPFNDNHFDIDENIIYNAAIPLIDHTIDFVTNNKPIDRLMDSLHYAHECKTVKVGAGRRQGHTTAIQYIADEYVPSMIIVPNTQIKRGMYGDYLIDRYHTNCIVPDIKHLSTARRDGCEYAVCLIDNSTFFRSEEINTIYQFLHDRVLVFVHFQ